MSTSYLEQDEVKLVEMRERINRSPAFAYEIHILLYRPSPGNMHSNADIFEPAPIGDDEDPLRRLSLGDGSAFWLIWQAHQDNLHAVCRRYLRNGADAEDALSNAMMRAFDALPRHAERISNLRGWLVRLTSNVCIDMLREQKRLQTGWSESVGEDTAVIASNRVNLESEYIREELGRTTVDALNELPDRLKLPLVMRYLDRLPYKKIACRLGIREDNTRKRIQLARDFLRERLAKAGIADTDAAFDRVFLQTALQRSRTVRLRSHGADLPGFNGTPRLVHFQTGPRRRYDYVLSKETLNSAPRRRKTLEKHVKRNPGGWKRRMDLARLLEVLGEYHKAATELIFICEKQPHLIEARLMLAGIFESLGREYFRKALAHYAAARAYACSSAAVAHLKARRLYLKGEPRRAAALLLRAAAQESGNPVHLQRLALEYRRYGCYQQALEITDRLLAQRPDDGVALTVRRTALLGTERRSDVAACTGRIRELHPEEPASLAAEIHSRCRSIQVRGNAGRRTRSLLRLLHRVAPDSIVATAAECDYLFAREEIDAARARLESHLATFPNDSAAWLYHARMLYRTGALRDAVDAIRRSHDLRASDPVRLPELAGILHRAGYTDLLAKILDAALVHYPCHAEILSRAAVGYALMQEDREFTRALAWRALELDPHSLVLQRRMKRIHGHHREMLESLPPAPDAVWFDGTETEEMMIGF